MVDADCWHLLSQEELDDIVAQLRQRVKDNGPTDYFQLFQHSETGLRILCEDNLDADELEELKQENPEMVDGLNYFSIRTV